LPSGEVNKTKSGEESQCWLESSLYQIGAVSLVGGSLVDQQSRIGILYKGDSQSSWTRAELEKRAKLES
jgi:hypothetical protein